jgi:hypothetical protein
MDSQGSHGNTVAGCAKRARLVADSLERRWNEKLTELAKAEEEYARAVKAEDPDLSQRRESAFMRWSLICPELGTTRAHQPANASEFCACSSKMLRGG